MLKEKVIKRIYNNEINECSANFIYGGKYGSEIIGVEFSYSIHEFKEVK